MSPEQEVRMETVLTEALGRATDEQIDEMAALIIQQSLFVREMKNRPPGDRMSLAVQYTELRQKSDLLWMAMIGMGLKMVVDPKDGKAKGVGYMTETGAPVVDMTFSTLLQLPSLEKNR